MASYCQICSYRQPFPREQKPLYHQHFSSLRLRMDILNVEDNCLGFYCPSCKSQHRPYTDDRLNVILSDSTLHNFFAPLNPGSPEYEGDLVHVDYVTIAGGLIPELHHAYIHDYVDIPPRKPLDVVVVAGDHDILEGISRDQIMEQLRALAHAVLSPNENKPEKDKHTFAISSLMYPPKYCWFRDNGPEPYQYTNQKSKVDWLNSEIHQLNLENNVPVYPGFHTYGTRVASSFRRYEGERKIYLRTRTHRWEHWLEGPRKEKFTLRADRLFVMGKAVNNYFAFRT